MKQSEPLSFIEQALVRSAGSWWLPMMASGATEVAISAAKSTIGGGSTTLRGQDGWRQITAKGIGWSPRLVSHSHKPSDFEVFVTWVRLKAHVESVLTEPLIEDAVAYREAAQKANHDGLDHSCPNRHADAKGAERWEKWWHETHMPQWRALQAQRKELFDRILPSLIDWEEESESLPSD